MSIKLKHFHITVEHLPAACLTPLQEELEHLPGGVVEAANRHIILLTVDYVVTDNQIRRIIWKYNQEGYCHLREITGEKLDEMM